MPDPNTTELFDLRHSVFVVEDEALIAMEISDHLVDLGYAVCGTASRGEMALGLIEESVPDVVLMDVKLAGEMNGIETAARLRRRCDVPVIYLTAFSDDELIRDAAQTAPYGYILKPFDERELRANIEMALGKRRAEKERRQHESRSRTLVEFAPESIQVLSADGVVLSVNPPGVALYQAESTEQLVGKAASAWVAPNYQPAFEEMITVVARGETRTLEFEIEGAKGDRRQISAHAVPIPNPHEPKARPQILVVAHEVTACSPMVRTARDLQIERASTLATGIAEHLTDYLNFILGSAEMACHDLNPKKGDPIVDDLKEIVAAADSAEIALRNLLDFSGYVGPEAVRLEIGQVVEDALDEVESRHRTGTPVARQIGAACPPVMADAGQLRRAVVELCENARRALPGGNGHLELRVETRDFSDVEPSLRADPLANTYIALSVTDDGHGMNDATLERIFDPFFTTSPGKRHTGMGLAAVRSVVEAHGGTVAVKSTPGEGSSFTLFLPAATTASRSLRCG